MVVGGVEQHQRTNLGIHQAARIGGHPLEDFFKVERRDAGLHNLKQRIEAADIVRDGSVEPDVVNDLGGLIRERDEQFFVVGTESVRARGVHVEHADEFFAEHQRGCQLAAHVRAHGNIPTVRPHIRHAQRLAGLGNPPGHPLPDGELQLADVRTEAERDFNFEQLRMRIHQHDRPAGGMHQRHRFPQHQIQHPLRFQRGIDHLADPRQNFVMAEFWHRQLARSLMAASSLTLICSSRSGSAICLPA